MPSSIYVAGKSIATPGVYTSVDASGLDVVGQSASGIIGVIGTAVGGTPYTALSGPQDFVSITNPAQGSRLFASGDLLEAVSIAFNPSNDTAIQGGAQQMFAMQVNPSTQATLSLDGGYVAITAIVYGAYGNKISIAIAPGSQSGQMVTLTDGTRTEVGDNIDITDASGVVGWINKNSQLAVATLTQEQGQGDVNGVIIKAAPDPSAPAGAFYAVALNNDSYEYFPKSGDGPVQILTGMAAAINNGNHGLTATLQQPDPTQSVYQVLVTIPDGKTISITAPLQVTATPVTIHGPVGAFNPPALTLAAATNLAGGSDGQATFADWQNCLNLLKQVRCNTVVALTTDPSVHAALDAHCAYMCGLGQSERDGFVGIASSQASGLPSRTEILNALGGLNTYNLRACAEQIVRYNSQGVQTTFPTYFTGLLGAGMQAGSVPGVSLTRKRINALGVLRDKTWNLVDNREEMILAGLLFLENKTNVGIRWVRNVTTWTTDNNSAYSDGGVRNALNYAVYNLREAIDFAIGQENFAGTSNAIVAIASQQLRTLISENVITAYRALSATVDPTAPDGLLLNVQLAPTEPINFVKFTISLSTAAQIAAAA